MTEKATMAFGEVLRQRARGEDPTPKEGQVPPELIERGTAALAEKGAVLEELAALGAEEEAAEEGAGA